MDDKLLNRINELARKSRNAGLNDTEKAEQTELRKKYIELYRKNLVSQLENIVIREPDGTEHPLEKKKG